MPDPKPKTKPKKVGRPKLAKGDAKAVMLRVRISLAESRAIEAKAKASKQTVSEWIRSTLFREVAS
jgi:predicted HicB family RNase H-like nuclease